MDELARHEVPLLKACATLLRTLARAATSCQSDGRREIVAAARVAKQASFALRDSTMRYRSSPRKEIGTTVQCFRRLAHSSSDAREVTSRWLSGSEECLKVVQQVDQAVSSILSALEALGLLLRAELTELNSPTRSAKTPLPSGSSRIESPPQPAAAASPEKKPQNAELSSSVLRSLISDLSLFSLETNPVSDDSNSSEDDGTFHASAHSSCASSLLESIPTADPPKHRRSPTLIARVSGIAAGSPAQLAGLREGDVISCFGDVVADEELATSDDRFQQTCTRILGFIDKCLHGEEIIVSIERPSRRTISMIAEDWNGPGFLGCELEEVISNPQSTELNYSPSAQLDPSSQYDCIRKRRSKRRSFQSLGKEKSRAPTVSMLASDMDDQLVLASPKLSRRHSLPSQLPAAHVNRPVANIHDSVSEGLNTPTVIGGTAEALIAAVTFGEFGEPSWDRQTNALYPSTMAQHILYTYRSFVPRETLRLFEASGGKQRKRSRSVDSILPSRTAFDSRSNQTESFADSAGASKSLYCKELSKSNSPSASVRLTGYQSSSDGNLAGRWLLANLYASYPRRSAAALHSSSGAIDETELFQLRFIALLRGWIDTCFIDFSKDLRLLEDLSGFISRLPISAASQSVVDCIANVRSILEDRVIESTLCHSKNAAALILRTLVRQIHGEPFEPTTWQGPLLDTESVDFGDPRFNANLAMSLNLNLVVTALYRAKKVTAKLEPAYGRAQTYETVEEAGGGKFSGVGGQEDAIKAWLHKRLGMAAFEVQQLWRRLETAKMIRKVDVPGTIEGDDAAPAIFELARVHRNKIEANYDLAPAPIIPTSAVPSFLDLSSTEIARQLTLVDFWRFRTLTHVEFLKQPWNKDDALRRAPHVMKIITKFNETCLWVATEVVCASGSKRRAKTLKKFLRLADALLELRNYHSFMAVVSGLANGAVQKLKSTWSTLASSLRKRWNYMEEFASGGNNFSLYRRLEAQAISVEASYIPYLGLILRDMTFAEDANRDLLNDEKVNWEKFSLIGTVLSKIPRAIARPYDLVPVEAVRTFLMSDIYMITDAKELYRIAAEAEFLGKHKKKEHAASTRGFLKVFGGSARHLSASAAETQMRDGHKENVHSTRRTASAYTDSSTARISNPNSKRRSKGREQRSTSTESFGRSGSPSLSCSHSELSVSHQDMSHEHDIVKLLQRKQLVGINARVVVLGVDNAGTQLIHDYRPSEQFTESANLKNLSGEVEVEVSELLFSERHDKTQPAQADAEIHLTVIDAGLIVEPTQLNEQIKSADGIILIVDMDDRNSIEAMQFRWLPLIDQLCHNAVRCVAVCNKRGAESDRPRAVSEDELKPVLVECGAMLTDRIAPSDRNAARSFFRRLGLALAENIATASGWI